MEKRKEKLLRLVVENYLRTAEPVGSKFLIESADLELSGATVRNEMRELEENGFLSHPHTSAGRIPTEAGYRYYITNIMKANAPKKKVKKQLDSTIKRQDDAGRRLKDAGKYVAGYMNSAVIIALHPDNVYYTGISNLFIQPEFHDYTRAADISGVFDQCEELMGDLYDIADNIESKVLIGKDNPFSSVCGMVTVKVGNKGLVAVLGPMRMDYGKAIGVLDYILEII